MLKWKLLFNYHSGKYRDAANFKYLGSISAVSEIIHRKRIDVTARQKDQRFPYRGAYGHET